MSPYVALVTFANTGPGKRSSLCRVAVGFKQANPIRSSLAVLLVRNRLCLFDNGWLDLNRDARPLERPRVDQPLAKGLRLLG
jgi:hypothetical protein